MEWTTAAVPDLRNQCASIGQLLEDHSQTAASMLGGGDPSVWLYEVLAPHVQEIVVAGTGGEQNRGPKSGKREDQAGVRRAVQLVG